MNIYILQDSGETDLRCGGKHYHLFVANFLMILIMKEFWNLVNICQLWTNV